MTKPNWLEMKITIGNILLLIGMLITFMQGYARLEERQKNWRDETQKQYDQILVRLDRIEKLHMKP